MSEVPDPTATAPPGRLLTVGIPVFNGRSLLRACLRSVVDSTLPRDRFEIVVADDGSTEPETLAILAELEQQLAGDPGFFRVLRSGSNSGGAARPRNRVLDEATGDYVFFVDSDDTIGGEALERIAGAVADTPADWIAVNQVPVNGRAAVARVREPQVEVTRTKALTTLTVHKVFRRAEIERQQLRFDEGLPSGQDVAFAFSFLVNASRFLMLGGYEYYYLTQHGGDPNEPAHLSRRARTPDALIEKNERILRSMLDALRRSGLPEAERREIVAQIVLHRVLASQHHLKAIVKAGPVAGSKALRRLSELLADPLVEGIDPAGVKGVTEEQLAVVARADWAGLAKLVIPAATQAPAKPQPRSPAPSGIGVGTALRWVRRGRRLLSTVSGRAHRRQLVAELTQLRRSVQRLQQGIDELGQVQRRVDDLRLEQRRLEANLQAEFQLRDMLAGPGPDQPGSAMTPLNPGWQLSSQALREIVRHVLLERPTDIVECGSGASTLWIGRALRRLGEGRLVSLESSADWVEIIGQMLRYEGLDAVQVRHAPLEPVPVAGQEQPWYAVSALADVEKIDLLLVDGPPGRTAKLARYPAVPVLRDRLRPGSTVLLDDCHRRDEKETLRRWLAEVPGLSLVHRVDRTAVLRLS